MKKKKQFNQLTLKYRPQKFKDFIGQKDIVEVLQNSVNSGKIARAYLFVGVRGTGKTSMARVFSMAINCENYDDEPCGECDSCIEIKKQISLDVREVDAASNRGIDECRAIIDFTKYLPGGNHKLVIVDEAHSLTAIAIESLLKTVEEGNVTFIFVTTNGNKIPATIKSRCRIMQFNPIKPKLIQKRLKRICEKEDIQITDKVLVPMSELYDGSYRDVLMLLDTLAIKTKNKIKQDDYNKWIKENYLYGGNVFNLMNVINAIKKKNFKMISKLVYELSTSPDVVRDFIFQLLKVTKKIMILHEKEKDCKLFEALYDLSTQINYYGQVRTYLEFGLIKISIQINRKD